MCWCVNTKKLIPHRFSSTSELQIVMSHCGISAHTYMYVLSAIMGNDIPYFAESLSLIFLCAIGWYRMCLCVITKKLIPLRFSSAPELISHSGIVSESEVWNRLYIIFLGSHTSEWYVPPSHDKILDCLRNIDSELPLLQIFTHTSVIMHHKMTCVLWSHGFGWQKQNTGMSVSILL